MLTEMAIDWIVEFKSCARKSSRQTLRLVCGGLLGLLHACSWLMELDENLPATGEDKGMKQCSG